MFSYIFALRVFITLKWDKHWFSCRKDRKSESGRREIAQRDSLHYFQTVKRLGRRFKSVKCLPGE